MWKAVVFWSVFVANYYGILLTFVWNGNNKSRLFAMRLLNSLIRDVGFDRINVCVNYFVENTQMEAGILTYNHITEKSHIGAKYRSRAKDSGCYHISPRYMNLEHVSYVWMTCLQNVSECTNVFFVL